MNGESGKDGASEDASNDDKGNGETTSDGDHKDPKQDSLKEEPADSEDAEKNPLEEETSKASEATSDSEATKPEEAEEEKKPKIIKPKPFKCDVCGYATSARAGLNFHKKERVHQSSFL